MKNLNIMGLLILTAITGLQASDIAEEAMRTYEQTGPYQPRHSLPAALQRANYVLDKDLKDITKSYRVLSPEDREQRANKLGTDSLKIDYWRKQIRDMRYRLKPASLYTTSEKHYYVSPYEPRTRFAAGLDKLGNFGTRMRSWVSKWYK